MDVDPRRSISPHSRTAARHDPLILAHGVVEAVEHPASFVQVADENVVAIGIVEPPVTSAFGSSGWSNWLQSQVAVGRGPTGPSAK